MFHKHLCEGLYHQEPSLSPALKLQQSETKGLSIKSLHKTIFMTQLMQHKHSFKRDRRLLCNPSAASRPAQISYLLVRFFMEYVKQAVRLVDQNMILWGPLVKPPVPVL